MSELLSEAMAMFPQQVWEERGRHQGWEGSAVEEEKTSKESKTGALGLEPGRLQGPEGGKAAQSTGCQLGRSLRSLAGNLIGWRSLREVKADILTGSKVVILKPLLFSAGCWAL